MNQPSAAPAQQQQQRQHGQGQPPNDGQGQSPNYQNPWAPRGNQQGPGGGGGNGPSDPKGGNGPNGTPPPLLHRIRTCSSKDLLVLRQPLLAMGGDGEGREEDDQDERDEIARRRDRQRIREADEVKILVFPQGTAWRAWRNNTTRFIVSAARRHDDSALEWIMKAETHEQAYLEHPGHGWITLDRKTAAALTNISNGELGRALTLHSNACLSQGRSARGRVLLQIVFNHYSSGKNAELMYDISRLQKITLKGDHLEAFQTIG